MKSHWQEYPDDPEKALSNILVEAELPVFTERRLRERASVYDYLFVVALFQLS